MRRKVTNRPRGTTVITSTTRDTAIKAVTPRGTNGRNQIIVDETRRDSLLHNRQTHFAYIYVVENFVDRSRLGVWSDIEWRVSGALSTPRRITMTITILFLPSSKWHANLLQSFHTYLR